MKQAFRTVVVITGMLLALGTATYGTATYGEVIRETVRVPMRDGVQLATDVYREGTTTKLPVVLMRTPYNKERGQPAAERFAAAGYVAVVQDCRGKFASEGDFVPYSNEGQDGFDTIEWLGRQSWCNGRIGMWGSSYVGATQWLAAVENPPGLMTITPTATFTSFYRNLYLGGAVRLSLIAKWASGNSRKPERATLTSDWDKTLLHLPLAEIDDQIGWQIPWLEGMLTHPTPGGYWKRLDLSQDMLNLRLPMQHVVGYYDFFARESVRNFVSMQQQATHLETRKHQQLILGPWDHGTIGQSNVGDLDFGPEAQWDATAATLHWFDRFLKRDPRAAELSFAPVRYFVLGQNSWREAESWPPPGFEDTSFYLNSAGKANSRTGNGRLDRSAPDSSAPSRDESPDRFQADPSKPVPACPITDQRPQHAATWAPVDQRSIEDREDVLVYTSEPLSEPLTFAGNARAELFVSADTPDADWVVKLIDVHPEGASYNLCVGILRGRFRDSELFPQLLRPGETYKIVVDLGPIAAKLNSGHRLRVDVCGSYFPLFDRNSNSAEGPFGGTARVATETVYHSPAKASRIVLPVARSAVTR